MPCDKAIEVRDKLVHLTEEVMAGGDQEAHVIACCLAVGLEELENWMYNGNFTPSVRPYIDDRLFNIPFKKGEEDDGHFAGPPWDRKKEPALKSKALRRAIAKTKADKEKGKKMAALRKKRIEAGEYEDEAIRQPLTLATYGIDKWEKDYIDMFRIGDRAQLSRTIRMKTRAPMREIEDLIKEARKSYASIWGIDRKPGNACPSCDKTEIKSSFPRLYECIACGTNWGQ